MNATKTKTHPAFIFFQPMQRSVSSACYLIFLSQDLLKTPDDKCWPRCFSAVIWERQVASRPECPLFHVTYKKHLNTMARFRSCMPLSAVQVLPGLGTEASYDVDDDDAVSHVGSHYSPHLNWPLSAAVWNFQGIKVTHLRSYSQTNS